MSIGLRSLQRNDGRTILIEFKCARCGKTHVEPLSVQYEKAEGNIQCFKPPTGWTDAASYKPMLCDSCTEDYKWFLANPPARVKKEVRIHE